MDMIKPELDLILEHKDWKCLREILAELDPSDIAELLADMPEKQGGIIFRVQTRRRAAEIFSQLMPEMQERLVHALSMDQTRELIEGMEPDDRAALLDELPSEVSRRLLEVMPADKRRDTALLLGYPEFSAALCT